MNEEIKASDQERDVTVTKLREAVGEGRLTLTEFSERMETALVARSRGELQALTTDLPLVHTAPQMVPDGRRFRPTRTWRTSIALLSGVERKGRWRLEGMHTAVAMFGGVVLDLREAEVPGGQAQILAVAIMGGIEVIAPPGMDVHVDGVAILGGNETRIDADVVEGMPQVHVRAIAIMGGVEVKTKPLRPKSKRSLRRGEAPSSRRLRQTPPTKPLPDPNQSATEDDQPLS